MEEYNEEDPIIFSTSEEISIKDLVVMIADLLHFKGDIQWLTDKPDGQFRKPSDNSRVKEYLPTFQFTPIYEGLKKTISWFEENYPNIRS